MLGEGDFMPQVDKGEGQAEGHVYGKQGPCSKLHLLEVEVGCSGQATEATPELCSPGCHYGL